jgi:glycosyltransferase involved in cell wall biosynthesis
MAVSSSNSPTQPDPPPRARPNAAIQYLAESYDAQRPKVMGRHSASAGFLRAIVQHADVEAFYAFAPNRAEFKDFERRVAELGGQGKPTKWVVPGRSTMLAEVGCLYLAGPGLGDFAWQRRFGDERRYSLCGITHTVSSDRALDGLGELLTAPTQSWDAVVCTSRAVKAAAERLFESHIGYLEQRFGQKVTLPVQLPIIPLGVACADFPARAETAGWRHELRRRLGIAADDVALLFFGRLTFHAKAHPVPMFMAAERAQQALAADPASTQRRIHLVLVGQFPNAAIEGQFKDAVPRSCPNVPVHILDGADPQLARAAWYAGDVFVSLSDNIQESFGITPIEAMAAGLPVVVSDWDGYRDTVIEGETGLRVATTMPPAPAGVDLVMRYATHSDSYDHYIGATSQATAVDVRAAAEAIRRLAADEGLRRSMGEAGLRRARAVFDWRVVVGQYQALWEELAARRKCEQPIAPASEDRTGHSLRPDPFDMFQGHATRLIGWTDPLRLSGAAATARLEAVLGLPINTFSGKHLYSPDGIRRLVEHISRQPMTIAAIAEGRPLAERRILVRTIAWLKKYDIIEF